MRNLLMTVAFVAVAATTAFTAPAVQAQDNEINPWQHCGLGAMIFPDHGIAAGFSNIIWDLGTTAVTSASASPQTCNSNLLETAQFVNENYDQVAIELAIGEGRHITTMLTMMGCSGDARDSALQELRTEFSQIMQSQDFTTQRTAGKAEALYFTANAAATSCQAS